MLATRRALRVDGCQVHRRLRPGDRVATADRHRPIQEQWVGGAAAPVNQNRIRELRPLGSGRYRLLLTDGSEVVVSRTYSSRFRGDLL